MAKPRKTRAGNWELCIQHRLLPKRLYFTFDTEQAAADYGDEVYRWLNAGVIPAAFAEAVKGQPQDKTLTSVIHAWRKSGNLSRTDDAILGWLLQDAIVSKTHMSGLTYRWAEDWIKDLKLRRMLAPSSIRQRVQAISKALEWHIRMNPTEPLMNPLRMLPRGYSAYSEQDSKLLAARGLESRIDVQRDRRLLPGEADKIRAVLRGEVKVEGRERHMPRHPGMLELFETILHTGLRLREAYMIRKENVDFTQMLIRVQTTKQRHGQVVYRDVPIRPELYAVLRGYITPGPGLLFPMWDGDPETLAQTSSRLSNRFANVFAAAPCDSLTEHDLRHEATCQWFELKAEDGHWLYRPEEINKIMGWAPGSRMAARYASFRAASLAERLWQRVGVKLPSLTAPDH